MGTSRTGNLFGESPRGSSDILTAGRRGERSGSREVGEEGAGLERGDFQEDSDQRKLERDRRTLRLQLEITATVPESLEDDLFASFEWIIQNCSGTPGYITLDDLLVHSLREAPKLRDDKRMRDRQPNWLQTQLGVLKMAFDRVDYGV